MSLTSIRVALRALAQNRMRSALTMLGIIIGVAAVITMIGIGVGARRSLAKEIEALGTNIIRVYSGAGMFGGVRTGAGDLTTLTEADAEAIRLSVPNVVSVAPVFRGSNQIIYENNNWIANISGTTADYGAARDWNTADGRFFSAQEIDGGAKVAILGATVLDNLYMSDNPIGKIIRFNRVPFTVIGVLEKKGESPGGRDQDDIVLIPLRTAQRKIFGVSHVSDMWIKVTDTAYLDIVAEDTEALLRQRHRIAEGEENDFTVRNLAEILSQAEESNRIMSILLGSVGAVSLLVGGIGIMNIMLVSVTERTREIGIRMAVGARWQHIMTQFLTEAVVLSAVGGVAGVIIGIITTEVLASFAGWDTYISTGAIFFSFGFSAVVGIFFGIYPARKASLLDPVEALRYE